MSVTVGVIAKKAVTVLLGSKKGRKLIGYVVAIVLFLLMLPVIVILAMFGWMNGDTGKLIDQDQVIAGLPSSYREQFVIQDKALQKIADTFTEKKLTVYIHKAQAIYIACLTDKGKNDEDFFIKYADCFTGLTEQITEYDKISSAFGVTFSDKDITDLNEIYTIH